MHDLLQGKCTSDYDDIRASERKRQAEKELVVKVECPMGGSAQGFKDYPILVLIGAGIGSTPMISVLRELLRDRVHMQRTFCYWTTRDLKSFEWFTEVMDNIFEADPDNFIQIRHFLTSMKEDDRDLGAVLSHHATKVKHVKTNFNIVLVQYTHHQVQTGRPDWKDELESVKFASKKIYRNDCGVFLCGPDFMTKAEDEVCSDLSKKDRFQFSFLFQ